MERRVARHFACFGSTCGVPHGDGGPGHDRVWQRPVAVWRHGFANWPAARSMAGCLLGTLRAAQCDVVGTVGALLHSSIAFPGIVLAGTKGGGSGSGGHVDDGDLDEWVVECWLDTVTKLGLCAGKGQSR